LVVIRYAEPMKRTAATRALQQLAKVYETITISSLQEVIPFCSQSMEVLFFMLGYLDRLFK
jgi:hypothetical protein